MNFINPWAGAILAFWLGVGTITAFVAFDLIHIGFGHYGSCPVREVEVMVASPAPKYTEYHRAATIFYQNCIRTDPNSNGQHIDCRNAVALVYPLLNP